MVGGLGGSKGRSRGPPGQIPKSNSLGDFNEADEAVRQMVTTAWTDFAKTGNPGLSWTPQTSGSEIQYLNINSVSPIMEYAQDIHDRMQLWTEEVGTAK